MSAPSCKLLRSASLIDSTNWSHSSPDCWFVHDGCATSWWLAESFSAQNFQPTLACAARDGQWCPRPCLGSKGFVRMWRKSTTSFFFITVFVFHGVAFSTSRFHRRSLLTAASFHRISKHLNPPTIATMAGHNVNNVQRWPRLTFGDRTGLTLRPASVKFAANPPITDKNCG